MLITRRQDISRIITTGFLALAVATVLLCGTPRTGAQSSHHSEQVVFSGGGFSGDLQSPFGFWVWCEADSTNPYHGICNGAMYVYARGLTKHVTGTIAEPQDHIYKMTVASDDSSIQATLTNVGSINQGPHNTVMVHFAAPLPGGVGTTTNAVVNVTGPSN